jgi:hypothetical protein
VRKIYRYYSPIKQRHFGAWASQHGPLPELDQPLGVALARAFYWQQLLNDCMVGNGSEIALRKGLHHSTVNELSRLTRSTGARRLSEPLRWWNTEPNPRP